MRGCAGRRRTRPISCTASGGDFFWIVFVATMLPLLPILYASRRFAPFPIFARAESKAYFAHVAPLVGAATVEASKAHIAAMQQNQGERRMFSYQGLPIASLANAENIGVLP